jgi:hypothetical protein
VYCWPKSENHKRDKFQMILLVLSKPFFGEYLERNHDDFLPLLLQFIIFIIDLAYAIGKLSLINVRYKFHACLRY